MATNIVNFYLSDAELGKPYDDSKDSGFPGGSMTYSSTNLTGTGLNGYKNGGTWGGSNASVYYCSIGISGTPKKVGTFYYSVSFYNTSTKQRQENRYIVTVIDNTPPIITTNSLGNAKEGIMYSNVLNVISGRPVTWSVSKGILPQGLTIDQNTGLISGIPYL